MSQIPCSLLRVFGSYAVFLKNILQLLSDNIIHEVGKVLSLAFAFYESTKDANYESNDTMAQATKVSLSSNIAGVIDNSDEYDYDKFKGKKLTIRDK